MSRMSLRMGALGLIAQYPGSSGYDLLKTFNDSLANVWPATQSQLYGELNKLTTDGLIEVSTIGPRGRKEYRITDDGRQQLQTWLVSADPEPVRNPFLLRVFLLSEVSRAEAREVLAAATQATKAQLAHLDEIATSVEWDDSDRELFARIALEYGRHALAGVIDWSGWAEREI